MATEVVMPQMGESIAEGTITRWLKKVGEHVERDEPLFEISTDKVDAEIPSPAAGTLSEIRFNEGDTVEVNTVVAVLNGGDGASAAPTARSAPVEEAKEEPPPAKATEAPIAAPPEEPISPPPKPAPSAEPATPPPAPSSVSTRDNGEDTDSADELRKTKSSPLVRKIASEHGIDITQLEGTGLSGRVTKNDILSFIESGAVSPAPRVQAQVTTPAPARTQEPVAPPVKPAAGDRVEQMTVIRKKIAEHMVLSRRTSAHVTTVYEIDMTRIAKLREQHRESFQERTGTKLTFMPFIFQAITSGLRKFPIFNAQVSGDQIIYKNSRIGDRKGATSHFVRL